MPGSVQEHGGIIKHGAKVLYAYSEATVPKLTFIIRKAYGGAYIVMNSRPLGADYVAAWPSAEIAVMGASGASKIIFNKEALNKKNPDKFLKECEASYVDTFLNPYRAAEKSYIDEVIDPNETRVKAISLLDILKRKKKETIKKKHGNIPL
jgi:acetyl-CoA carboxylase carboxyltransferase component